MTDSGAWWRAPRDADTDECGRIGDPAQNPAIGPRLFERGDFKVARKTRAKPRRPRIRCPHCAWEPHRTSKWTCMPVGHPEHFRDACGHAWNTFDTRGLCPGCSHQWLHTSCLSCNRWALHEAWYEPEPGLRPDRL